MTKKNQESKVKKRNITEKLRKEKEKEQDLKKKRKTLEDELMELPADLQKWVQD